jgi:type III secretory pathway component EscS
VTVALLGQALRDVAVLAMWLALPFLIAVAIGGAIAALLGAVTQLQDSAITLLARLGGFVIAAAIFGPAVAAQVQHFGQQMITLIATQGGS